MRRAGRILGLALILLLWCGMWGLEVRAAESLADDLMDELELGEIDAAFGEMQSADRFSFSDAVKMLIQGEIPLTPEGVAGIMGDAFFGQLEESRGRAVRIMLLITASALFANFVNVFEKSQAADISFCMMYLALFTLLMQSFQAMEQMTMDALNQVITFMKLLMPSYFLASVFASGTASGTGFYEMTLGMILVIQWVIKYAVMPAVNLYVILSMADNLTKEACLSRAAELLKTFVQWSLRTLAALAIGLQTVQRLILPAVDSLRTAALTRTAGAMPGLGNAFRGVTEVVIGSAVLIKNAVGAAGLIFLALLCLVPFIKLGFEAMLYRLLAAVSQPISDKRMAACIQSAGEGAGLLMKALMTVGVLFFLSIALATSAVGG